MLSTDQDNDMLIISAYYRLRCGSELPEVIPYHTKLLVQFYTIWANTHDEICTSANNKTLNLCQGKTLIDIITRRLML